MTQWSTSWGQGILSLFLERIKGCQHHSSTESFTTLSYIRSQLSQEAGFSLEKQWGHKHHLEMMHVSREGKHHCQCWTANSGRTTEPSGHEFLRHTLLELPKILEKGDCMRVRFWLYIEHVIWLLMVIWPHSCPQGCMNWVYLWN